MAEMNLSATDVEDIRRRGMTEEDVLRQIRLFRSGAAAVTLDRPATMGDGVVRVPLEEQEELVAVHEEAAGAGRFTKFVPASGAATRMFKDWQAAFHEGGFRTPGDLESFSENLSRYAFFEDLRNVLSGAGLDAGQLIAAGRVREVLDFILHEKGLNYASKPKALLAFHRYGDRSRTALEEHLVEAALYVRDGSSRCRIHFTVSEEHLAPVRELLSRVIGSCERRLGVRYDARLSIQSASTDTVAVDADNSPLRARDGRLLFRPGGHGALLHNLDGIDGDLVFIKNIDNIVPETLANATVLYKKLIGGYLVRLQEGIFGCLRALSSPPADEEAVAQAARFARDRLSCTLPAGFEGMPLEGKRMFLLEQLDRPLRVCGMVRNEGEPGGGPFWVTCKDGRPALQIVEEVQVNKAEGNQASIWSASTYFNPVDLVCGIRDFRGRKFALHRFVDGDQVFISAKSHEGRDIRALERPGLWNGSMAFWNTVFVEVPVQTFNPVKAVGDLLRPAHRP